MKRCAIALSWLLLVEPVRADPSPAYLVKDINPAFGNAAVSRAVESNGLAFLFVGTPETGWELWKSDGTRAGTQLVKLIDPSASTSTANAFQLETLVDLGGTLYFRIDDGVHGFELWKSDGTAAGTVLVKDIVPGPGSSAPTSSLDSRAITRVGGTLFFLANDAATGTELWKSDGTASGTVLMRDINGGFNASRPDELIEVGGTLFFTATDSRGRELWKSDGTAAGTVLVKDIRPGLSASSPGQLVNVNGTLLFVADDGTNGVELWNSDGTGAGTLLVKDITAGATGTTFRGLVDFDGTLFFGAATDLWKSDGTDLGTVAVHSVDPVEMAVMDHALYISSGELWRSDGTAAGTAVVKEINPSGTWSPNPRLLTTVGNTLFFKVDHFISGTELWKSDGTEAGTVLVKDIVAGGGSSDPEALVNANGTLFFTANHGVHGRELWKSDGTAEGTLLVKDIWPGGLAQINSITAIGSLVVFAANDGVSGQEIWVSDGTPEGTRRVADVAAVASSAPAGFRQVGSLLFFSAIADPAGRELWAVPVAALTDADLDGLLDADERALGTDPFDDDTDDDGLSDGAEVDTHDTDPLLADTDGDGYSDAIEITAGSDPLDPQSAPPDVPLGGPWVYGVLAAGLITAARWRLRRAAAN